MYHEQAHCSEFQVVILSFYAKILVITRIGNVECRLFHKMLGRIHAHLVLEVGLRDLDNYFHISYLYIENF